MEGEGNETQKALARENAHLWHLVRLFQDHHNTTVKFMDCLSRRLGLLSGEVLAELPGAECHGLGKQYLEVLQDNQDLRNKIEELEFFIHGLEEELDVIPVDVREKYWDLAKSARPPTRDRAKSE